MSHGFKTTEALLTKEDTMAVSDIVRVVIGGASRNILLSNFISAINSQLNSVLRVTTVTANYLANLSNDVILADVSSGGVTITLPDATTAEGKIIQVKKSDNSTNDVTVQTAGGNIDGSATATLSGSGGAMPGASFVSDGTNWFILNA